MTLGVLENLNLSRSDTRSLRGQRSLNPPTSAAAAVSSRAILIQANFHKPTDNEKCLRGIQYAND